MPKLKIKNIVPLTELQRSPGKAVKQAIATGDPVVITQHGRPAVVMVDCETYEKLEQGAVNMEKRKTMPDWEREMRDELQRLLIQIVAGYDPERVILFGSLAEGDVNESSDIDLVIIKETKKRYWERQRELSRIVKARLACDIFIYTPEEWERAIREGRSFAVKEIQGKGKIIYERAA